jgi:prepilin-type N-terminal cleavage/methylation domain-containing protein
MNKYQVKAFTLMELTVAMLIASIVIGMTYTIYTIVVGSYRSFHTKNNETAMVIRLDELLKKDFAHADLIRKEEQGISCKSADQLVTYALGPGLIVRTAGAIDTFKVNVQDITTAFEAVPVTGTAGDEEQNRID